jgi:predicted dehydrogenase
MNKRLKIGILGCGAVAYRWYFKGLSGIKSDYSINVVCDIDLEKAKQAAEKFNVPNYCISINDLVNYDLDLVVVLTNHHNHYDHIKFLLENGINVYSEKPFANSVIEGMELIKLAKKNKLILGCAPQIMLSSRNIKVKELINKNKIGKVTLIRASCSNLGPAGRADTDHDPVWFYNDGGSMSSLGIYGLSTLLWLMGMPKILASFEGIAIPEREVMYGQARGKKFKVSSPDNVVSIFDFGDGTFALFDGSYSVASPPKYDFEIHGTKGSLFVGGFGGPESVIFKPLIGDKVDIGPDDDCHLRWNLSWGVEETIAAVKYKRETLLSADFALKVLNIMEMMKISSKEHRYISITK